MGILRSRAAKKFSKFGLLSDLALVASAATRFYQHKNGSSKQKLAGSTTELALLGGAALRLISRLTRRRKNKKALKAALVSN